MNDFSSSSYEWVSGLEPDPIRKKTTNYFCVHENVETNYPIDMISVCC